MKINKILILLWIGSLSFGCKEEIANNDFNKFTGLWSLNRIEQQNPETGEWNVWREGMQGYLLYDGQNNMAVHHTTVGYENTNLQFPNFTDTISSEALKHLTNSLVYFAKYRVDEVNNEIEHARISHSNPSQWDEVAKRSYNFSGDTLTLQPIKKTPLGILRLKWIKESVPNKK